MDGYFYCENPRRLERLRAHATLNGIDVLEVLDARAPAGSPRQQTLLVHTVKPLPATTDSANVRIEAAPRALPVSVVWAGPASLAASLFADGRISAPERDFFLALSEPDHTLLVRTDSTGDFSTYTLRLTLSPADGAPPVGFDTRLSHLAFSFKVECPSDFDCAPDDACEAPVLQAPNIDYLAKDYASFRRLMLDRLSVTLPEWHDRSAADLQVALVELLAYVGDHLSYAQDAVGTEAYLGTARWRVSLRRHARLLDYHVHEGTNARAFVHLRVTPGGAAENMTLPTQTPLATPGTAPVVFETMHDVVLRSAHNDIAFYTWGDERCCLGAGATRATLFSREAGAAASPLALREGDLVVFEEVVSPTTGVAADADRSHRHVVRLTAVTPTTDALTGDEVVDIIWHDGDALPFALCLSARVPAAGGGFVGVPVSVARANVVLADAGQTVVDQEVEPATVSGGRYRPYLRHTAVTFAEPFDAQGMQAQAAQAALGQDARRAMPARLTLSDGDETWQPRADLLGSDRFAPEFVVEIERDGRAHLRFGDDVQGKAPSAGARFLATYRVGSGPAGNVGAGAISQITGVPGIEGVRNPLAATGGTAAESAEEIQRYAPQAFRTQERAVTEDDYARVAERMPGIQRATARFRWTGSWTTVFLTIDRAGGASVRDDDAFLQSLRDHLDRYRMAGYDVAINDPVYVSLDMDFFVCVEPGYFRSDVEQALLQAFSASTLSRGARGFFHPDAFTFGQPVYLSQMYEVALGIDGVASIEARRFQRYGKAAAGELAAGAIQPSTLEVLRLDNNPSAPQDGKLTFTLAGGA